MDFIVINSFGYQKSWHLNSKLFIECGSKNVCRKPRRILHWDNFVLTFSLNAKIIKKH